ncbi:MAG: 30S ribosome-binding factor RbfA [Christensenellales bacterium]|jgi:ribosome-binding factor A
MADFSRTDRLSPQVRSQVYDIIKDLKDPRIPEVFTVTYANVTNDLRYAKIGISAMLDEKAQSEMMKALKGAAGFVRRELGARIDLRYTPEISFELDNSIERSVRIQSTLNTITRELEEADARDRDLEDDE